MSIFSSYNTGRTCLTISVGESLEFSNYKNFKELYEVLPEDATKIEIDLSKTNHIDSSALGILLLMQDYVEKQIARVDIINVSPGVKEIFDLTHFDKIFNISS